MTLPEAVAVLLYERESTFHAGADVNMFRTEREKATVATAKMIVAETAQKLLRGY
jgi:hypothetical protein